MKRKSGGWRRRVVYEDKEWSMKRKSGGWRRRVVDEKEEWWTKKKSGGWEENTCGGQNEAGGVDEENIRAVGERDLRIVNEER